jgi:hypothetical protein
MLYEWCHTIQPVRLILSARISQLLSSVFLSQQININWPEIIRRAGSLKA